MMVTSENGIKLIERFEGFRSEPYLCSAKVPTIGIGSTRYANGANVRLTDPAITLAQAKMLLAQTIKPFENAVNRYVQVKINQNQYDALVCFAYNVGWQALRTSTLLRKLNAGDIQGAANEFEKWNKAGGRKIQGLVNRRLAEKALFLS
jgi:lysozyme